MDNKTLSNDGMEAFSKDSKVGLLATVNETGLPHITLITTIEALDGTHLMWGQFTEGHSKRNVRHNPLVAFLVMSLEREIWRGRARWTNARQDGADFDHYNRKPLFRYNAYFGVHTVHYMDLVSVSDKEDLGLPAMLAGYGLVAPALPLAGRGAEQALKPWARHLFNQLDTVKFVSWVDDDGWPQLVPAVACMATPGRLVLARTGRMAELAGLPTDRTVAVFAMNMATESVLVRGRFRGFRAGRVGALDLDWVYNTMPPQAGQVFPPLPITSVAEF